MLRKVGFIVALLSCLQFGNFVSAQSSQFMRGDHNQDRAINIGDAVGILGFLFSGGSAPLCEDASDINDDGSINIGDAVSLLGFLFSGGVAPAEPFLTWEADPTPDTLGCKPVMTIGGDITSDIVLTNDMTWVLEPTFVKDGVTMTIQAGTTIVGMNEGSGPGATVEKLLGKNVQLGRGMNMGAMTMYEEPGQSTYGIPFAIDGTATVVEDKISIWLAGFQDPIKAVFSTSVHPNQKIIFKRKYVKGGQALVVPERAPARTVSVAFDQREERLTRHAIALEQNLNLYLREQDAKEDLDMKLEAIQNQLQQAWVSIAYEKAFSQGTNIVHALQRGETNHAREDPLEDILERGVLDDPWRVPLDLHEAVGEACVEQEAPSQLVESHRQRDELVELVWLAGPVHQFQGLPTIHQAALRMAQADTCHKLDV